MRALRSSFVLIAFSTAITAGAITDPLVGLVRYTNGVVATVYGVSGSYVTRQITSESANGLSFSKAGGILATADALELISSSLTTISRFDTAESAPLVSMGETEDSALAWLPSRRSIVHWTGTDWTVSPEVAQLPSNNVSSISFETQTTASLLVRMPDDSVAKALVSLKTGEMLSLTLQPGVINNAFAFRDWIICARGNRLDLQKADGTEKLIPLGATGVHTVQFERAGTNDVHIYTSQPVRDWMLHFGNETLSLTELPALPSEVKP